MEKEHITDRLRSFSEVLTSGTLTEIDLDGLSVCLRDVEKHLRDVGTEADSNQMLRNDLISEIIRFGCASSAMANGVRAIDPNDIREKICEYDSKALLELRQRTRAGFARLLRSGDLPRKIHRQMMRADRLADYKLENARV